ncbi:translational GTPase TypA [Candidatus Marinamargulisbacteria bacterium SCGC AG-343-D04]|nr:translational GTPase TypA [Candidatus Marinamargulisbacteria bacterium SCGC AG-343-D04]
MNQEKLRNVAIIAHVDHGKTTLVDQLFKASGMYRENQNMEERLMDSMDLERERGITIKSKNGACQYKDHFINIIDTPGHADFGGEVERVLKMAEGALFLVDAQEGPMPQSHFVLKKAIALNIPVIVVVNKIDKPNARVDWVIDQVFDLMVKLNAPDEILDFKTIYASARDGKSGHEMDTVTESMEPIFQSIIDVVPSPKGNRQDSFSFLVSTISYSTFLGRLAVGKIHSGNIKINQEVVSIGQEGPSEKMRITKICQFKSDQFEDIQEAGAGEIVALAGIPEIKVGETIADPSFSEPLEGVKIDPPTISVQFMANNSPFSGKEGEFVTSNQVKDRLLKETLSDVALHVDVLGNEAGFSVAGRGELHLSILIEKMRREGYEFQVSRPKVIFKEIDGKKCEPYEEISIQVQEEQMGVVIESMGNRKGHMQHMNQEDGAVNLIFHIPTRGLLGYQSEFMTQTKGMGTLFSKFLEYRPFSGEIRTRKNGVLISKETAKTIAYSLDSLQERGVLFLGPGVDIYEGQIIGESSREEDMVVNPAKGKKLTNMRASGSDDNVMLTPPKKMSLEECLSFIDDTELVECTPKSIRLRKIILSESGRKSNRS